MKRYNNYIASIGFFIVALLVTSCSDEQEIELASLEMNARLNLTISTRAAADDQVKVATVNSPAWHFTYSTRKTAYANTRN